MSSNPFGRPTDRPTTQPAPASGPFPEWPEPSTVKDRAGAAQHTPTEDQPPRDPAGTAMTWDSHRGDDQPANTGQPSPDALKDHASSSSSSSSDEPRKRRRLTNAEARRVRERYAHRREMAEAMESPEDWESVAGTEDGLAAEFKTTRATIRNIVLGTTFPRAGGPLDTARRARRDQYQADRDTYGAEVAMSKYMSYRQSPGVLTVPPMVKVTITEPGKDPVVHHYPAGTAITLGPAEDSSGLENDLTEPGGKQ